ncbi:MAG: patatin-like phospholipase family protein [Actinomycetota bacterium]|jgi:NTE family protein|uniref:patatin-like phospholipase family protein n=1 Tax=uncultured Ilumatobacter sp. TaxID=879968 RepID=UPI00374E7D67|nr:patatin-like phospholipase family protein [Actinomycetota bacterium]
MTTAFVLSGGASLGSIQVGMAIALADRGIVPDLVVGTSVGAMNGAWLAGGRSAHDLAEVWRTLRRDDLFPTKPLLGLRAFLGKSLHFVPDTHLRATLAAHLPFERIENAAIPFIAVAADALSGEEVLITEGNAVDAVTASASLPAVFPPARVVVNGRERLLVDGAVVNNTAITTAIDAGATDVWVLSTGYSCDLVEPPRTAIAAALHAVSLMVQRRFVLELEANTYGVPIHLIPPPCPVLVSPIDFSQSSKLIESAASSARAWFDAGQPGAQAIPQVRKPG